MEEIKKYPQISVIIPVFNAEKYILDTIRSVMNQTICEIEIIVINDGSTDGSGKLINSLAENDNRILTIHQSNLGVSASRNEGRKVSRGKFLAFLDADDLWLPNNLELKLEKMNREGFGLVHSDGQIIDEFGNLKEEVLAGEEGNLLEGLLLWKKTQIPSPSSILIRREVIDKVGDFDEKLSTSADQDFYFRVASQYQIGRVDRITWYYRIHDRNMHQNILRMEKDVLRVYKKAENSNLFCNRKFKRRCYSNMYMILAASWAGDGNNFIRGLYFVWKALLCNPTVIFNILKRLIKKCFRD